MRGIDSFTSTETTAWHRCQLHGSFVHRSTLERAWRVAILLMIRNDRNEYVKLDVVSALILVRRACRSCASSTTKSSTFQHPWPLHTPTLERDSMQRPTRGYQRHTQKVCDICCPCCKLELTSPPAAFHDQAIRWFDCGARVIGGCCRTTPEVRITTQSWEISLTQHLQLDHREGQLNLA